MKYEYTFEVRASHNIINKTLNEVNEIMASFTNEKESFTADIVLVESIVTTDKELNKKEIKDVAKTIKDSMIEFIKDKNHGFNITTVKHIKTNKMEN